VVVDSKHRHRGFAKSPGAIKTPGLIFAGFKGQSKIPLSGSSGRISTTEREFGGFLLWELRYVLVLNGREFPCNNGLSSKNHPKIHHYTYKSAL
jgi:hypothetical protein